MTGEHMADFTGTDLSGIYNPFLSGSNLDYLTQILESQGYTLDQVANMSQNQINALVSSIVASSTGSAPSSDVFTGGTSGQPSAGLPPGYTYNAQGQAVPAGSGVPAPANSQVTAPTQMPPSGTGQTSEGEWVHYGGADGTQAWNPTQGKPQEMVNAEMGLANPWQLPQMAGQMSGKPPAPGQGQPHPPANIPLPPHTSWQPMSGDNGETLWVIAGPNTPVTAAYHSDGTPAWTTTKDAAGFSTTTYQNGSKILVTPNGWKTVYDSTGKAISHTWAPPPPPTHQQQVQQGVAQANAQMGQILGGVVQGNQINPSALAGQPGSQQGPHALLKPGDYQMHPAVAAKPAQNINATFGGLGYSGPTSAVAAQPWQPPTPTNPNPDLGIVPGGAGPIGGGFQYMVNQGGVPVPYDPNVHTPDQAYKAGDYSLAPGQKGVDYLKGQDWASYNQDKQSAYQQAQYDADAAGGAGWQKPGPPPDDTPGYGNNPPAGTTPPPAGTIGAPTSGAPAPVPPAPAPNTQPPVIQPPQVGIEPPNVLYGGGEVKPMPNPVKPVSYPSPTATGSGITSGYVQIPAPTQGGNFTQVAQQQMMTDQLAAKAQYSPGGMYLGAPAGVAPAPVRQPAPSPLPAPSPMPPVPAPAPVPTIQPPSPTSSYGGTTSETFDASATVTQPPTTAETDVRRSTAVPTIKPIVRMGG